MDIEVRIKERSPITTKYERLELLQVQARTGDILAAAKIAHYYRDTQMVINLCAEYLKGIDKDSEIRDSEVISLPYTHFISYRILHTPKPLLFNVLDNLVFFRKPRNIRFYFIKNGRSIFVYSVKPRKKNAGHFVANLCLLPVRQKMELETTLRQNTLPELLSAVADKMKIGNSG